MKVYLDERARISAGEAATSMWVDQHRELFLSVDEVQVGEALSAFCRTEGQKLAGADADAEMIYTILCVGFVSLYKRGVIVPIRGFSTEGQRQLDELFRDYNIVKSANATPQPIVDSLEGVIADFNGGLSMLEFKRKCQQNPEYAKSFDAAVAAGRV